LPSLDPVRALGMPKTLVSEASNSVFALSASMAALAARVNCSYMTIIQIRDDLFPGIEVDLARKFLAVL